MAVDKAVLQTLATNPVADVLDPLRDMFAKRFLADEVTPSAGKPQHAGAGGQLFAGGLILKLASENIHLVAHAGEALGEFQHKNDLAAGVRQTQFRLSRNIAVCRDHHDPLVGRRHDASLLSVNPLVVFCTQTAQFLIGRRL